MQDTAIQGAFILVEAGARHARRRVAEELQVAAAANVPVSLFDVDQQKWSASTAGLRRL
jgi:hypothetical protein